MASSEPVAQHSARHQTDEHEAKGRHESVPDVRVRLDVAGPVPEGEQFDQALRGDGEQGRPYQGEASAFL